MQIEVKGRNAPVTDELREYVERRFRKVAKQVSELARLEVEFTDERNPAIADSHIVEVTLYLKGTVLRASDRARDGVDHLLVDWNAVAQGDRERQHRRGVLLRLVHRGLSSEGDRDYTLPAPGGESC